MARFGFCAASSLICGGGGGMEAAVPFYSVQDNGYFGDSFWPKKLLDAKGPFVDQKSG